MIPRIKFAGELVRAERIRKGWSLRQFAKKVGVSFQAVSHWENGDAMPYPHHIKTVAKVLNIAEDKLVYVDQGAEVS